MGRYGTSWKCNTVTAVLLILVSFLEVHAIEDVENAGSQILLWEAPKEFAKRYPYYIAGYDEKFRPVVIWDFGKWDIRSLVEGGGRDFEIYKNYSRQFVKRIQSLKSPFLEAEDGIVLILDADGFQWNQVAHFETTRYMLQESLKLQAMAPNIHRGIVINANFVMENLIRMARLLHTPETLKKLEVYGSDSEDWVPKLLKTISKDQLPSWYGGTEDFVPVEVFG